MASKTSLYGPSPSSARFLASGAASFAEPDDGPTDPEPAGEDGPRQGDAPLPKATPRGFQPLSSTAGPPPPVTAPPRTPPSRPTVQMEPMAAILGRSKPGLPAAPSAPPPAADAPPSQPPEVTAAPDAQTQPQPALRIDPPAEQKIVLAEDFDHEVRTLDPPPAPAAAAGVPPTTSGCESWGRPTQPVPAPASRPVSSAPELTIPGAVPIHPLPQAPPAIAPVYAAPPRPRTELVILPGRSYAPWAGIGLAVVVLGLVLSRPLWRRQPAPRPRALPEAPLPPVESVVRSPPRPAPAVRTPAPAPPEPALKRATTAEPEAPRGYRAQLAEARRLFQEGRTRDARRLFEQLREERDDDPEVHVGLGACALRSERFLAAIEHYRAALERRPDHPAAVMGLAETYRRRGQVEEALTWYRTYLKNPDNPKARQARTQIARLEELQGLSTGP